MEYCYSPLHCEGAPSCAGPLDLITRGERDTEVCVDAGKSGTANRCAWHGTRRERRSDRRERTYVMLILILNRTAGFAHLGFLWLKPTSRWAPMREPERPTGLHAQRTNAFALALVAES